jgi:hypothetical protein
VDKLTLGYQNIAAYWRALAGKTQNPEARLRFSTTAAHYEELAAAGHRRDERSHYVFSYAAKQRILLVQAGPVVNEHTYLQGYDAITRFICSRGPCSMIFDLSAVEEFNISAKFTSTVARRKPAIPPGMSRLVVAPQERIYDLWHSVEVLRSPTTAPFRLVARMEEALAHFHVSRWAFSELGRLSVEVSSQPRGSAG